MKTIVKVTLSDQQRNEIARKLDGKNCKRMISRKEVNSLVAGFMEGLLDDLDCARTESHLGEYYEPAKPDLSRVPEKYRDRPVEWQLGWLRGWDRVGRGRAY